METTSGEPKRYPGTELIKLERQVKAIGDVWSVANTLNDLRPLELQRAEAMRELMHAFRETRDLTGYVTVGTEDAEAGIFPAPLDRPYRDEAGDAIKRMYVVLTLQGFKAIEFVRDLSAQNVDEKGRPMPIDFDDRSVQRMIRDITTRESGVRQEESVRGNGDFYLQNWGIRVVDGKIKTGYFHKGNSSVKSPVLVGGDDLFQIYAGLGHEMTISGMGYLEDLDLGAGFVVVNAIEASMRERGHNLKPEKIQETTQIAQKLREFLNNQF